MGGGVYAHRYTHGGPPRPHLIVQCTTLRRVYDTCIKPTIMAKTVKLTKMASNDNLYATVSGSEGSIHINLHKGVITGYQPGIKVLKGTYYRQTAKERVKRGE